MFYTYSANKTDAGWCWSLLGNLSVSGTKGFSGEPPIWLVKASFGSEPPLAAAAASTTSFAWAPDLAVGDVSCVFKHVMIGFNSKVI